MTDSVGLRSGFGCVLVLAAAIALSGCAEWKSVKRSVVPQTGDTYYASATLPLHAKSSASSKVVGHLALYEEVTRVRTEHGYAYVAVGSGGLEGWVENAKLVRRIPVAGAAPKPTASEPAKGKEESAPESSR